MNRTIFGILALTVTAGCNDAAPVHTSEYYRTHLAEARVRMADCDKRGLESRDADCLNAQVGDLEHVITSAQDVSPWTR